MSLRPALALLVAAVAARTPAMPVDSRITAVTVFADRAVVTRNATLDLTSTGTAEVTFENLPASLIEGSLSAVNHGAARARVLNVAGLPGAPGGTGKTAVIRLDVTDPGACDLTLTYSVAGASWTPTYEARVVPAERVVEFGCFALVRQKTGENWENIGLTLSTLNADGTASQAYAASTSTGPVSPHPVGDAAKPIPAPPPAPAATLQIPGTITVGSSDAPTQVAVASKRLASENDYRVTASSSDKPVPSLTVTATNSFPFPLLAGSVKLASNRAGVTRSIRTVMPGESFHFANLDDRSFVVTRTQNRGEDDGPDHQGWRFTYDITVAVQNTLPIAEKIALGYHIPKPGISGRKKTIVVKLLPPTDPAARIGESAGLLWELTLAPGEIRAVPVNFSIEFLDVFIRQGHVKIGDLQIVDDRAPAPDPAKK